MILYTTQGCPKCRILKQRLDEAGLQYTETQDVSKLIEMGFQSAPILEKDNGELLGFKEALDYIKA